MLGRMSTMLVAAIVAFLATTAASQPAESVGARRACPTNDYGLLGANERDIPEAPQDNNSTGTFAQMFVGNPDVTCQKVNSVYVDRLQNISGNTGSAEFAWVIGKTQCPTASVQFTTEPILLYVYVPDQFISMSQVKCGVFPNIHPSTGDRFKVQYLASDARFHFYYEGVSRASVTTNFSQAYNLVSMERGSAADFCYSDFTNLQELHEGNGWTAWNTPHTAAGSNDPDCHVALAPARVKMEQ